MNQNIKRYRKQPVEIEAIRYLGETLNKNNTSDWVFSALKECTIYYDDQGELFIKTLEGDHHVSVGDYIIQGIHGELYPCKPDIFRKTHEEIN